MQITEILNEVFSNSKKNKELYKLWLVAYAQAFPDFVLPLFVAPFLIKKPSWTKSEIVSMGGAKEGTKTIMEVDSIAAKVATKNT